MKRTTQALTLVTSALLATSVHSQNLMITGVMDGTLTGGTPKTLEIFAINDIPDLSKYAIGLAANGGAFSPITAEYVLPAIPLPAGSFFYGVGNAFGDQTAQFDSVFPAYASIRQWNFGVNSNGDDVEGLFYDPSGLFTGGETLVDVFGELGVDGTGTAWEHLDGWAYSNNGRTPSATFNVADWSFSGVDALDGLDAAGLAAAFPDQTFVVPEPSIAALLGLGLLAIARSRKS